MKKKEKKRREKEKKKEKEEKLERPNTDFRVHQSTRGPGASPFFYKQLIFGFFIDGRIFLLHLVFISVLWQI